MDRVREMEEKLEAVVNAVVNNNHIPRDPAFSVLSKLPLKSLKRFGCASKSWGHLFENSLFMSMYRNNSPHTSLLLNLEFDYSVMYLLSGERFETRVCLDFPSAFPTRASTSYVFGSSVNGILCLYYGHNRVVLWNPSTREFKVVPPSPVEFESPSPVEFESHNQELYFDYKGFGYDHVKDDYRMIRCINFSELSDVPYNLENVSFEPLWEIYSLRSDSWKKLDCKMHTGSLDYCNGARLYTNGACHWWGIDENGLPSCLVSFDLNNELFFTTPMPSYIDGIFDLFHELFITTSPIPSHLFPVQLGVISGSVALISNYSEKTTIEVSILGEVGVKESWTKLFIIGPLPCVVNLVGVGKKGDIFFNNEDGELAFFDWSTHMIVGLGIKASYCKIVTYKENFESLISLGFQKYDCRLC